MKKIPSLVCVFILLIAIMSCGSSGHKLDCTSSGSFAESSHNMLEYLAQKGSKEEKEAFSCGIFKISMEFDKSGDDLRVLRKYDKWTIQDVIKIGK